MKTIFDKVNPKYIDCATGICEHTSHTFNTGYIAIAVVLLLAVGILEFSRR